MQPAGPCCLADLFLPLSISLTELPPQGWPPICATSLPSQVLPQSLCMYSSLHSKSSSATSDCFIFRSLLKCHLCTEATDPLSKATRPYSICCFCFLFGSYCSLSSEFIPPRSSFFFFLLSSRVCCEPPEGKRHLCEAHLCIPPTTLCLAHRGDLMTIC